MQTLDVLNEQLGTMGEQPLASLEEPHEFKGAGLKMLSTENRECQATGWWFNIEQVTLEPMLNGRIPLGNDIINIRTQPQDAHIVQRGRYLYDTQAGTDLFDRTVCCIVIRLIAFDDLPESVAQYIAAKAVYRFQVLYDGDTTRTQELSRRVGMTLVDAKKDDIRNKRVNLIEANWRLMLLKSRTNVIRRY